MADMRMDQIDAYRAPAWLRASLALLAWGVAACSSAPEETHAPGFNQDMAGGFAPDPGEIAAGAGAAAAAVDRLSLARAPVEWFDAAFNAGSVDDAAAFTTEDWNHINPAGGWSQGRDNVLATLREDLSTILSGVTRTVEDTSVRFATDDVALVTTTSRLSPWPSPDRVRVTSIVVERNGRWLLMQNQATWDQAPVPSAAGPSDPAVPVDTGSEASGEQEREMAAREAVRLYFAAFNAGSFENAADFAAEDWSHISPIGHLARGREAALAELEYATSTFLKGVTSTVEATTVRFAASDLAVVTVTSAMSPFTGPDGEHAKQSLQTTFVVCNRNGLWRVMHSQATILGGT